MTVIIDLAVAAVLLSIRGVPPYVIFGVMFSFSLVFIVKLLLVLSLVSIRPTD